ncbi:ABC transporter substrate-binding protein [Pigmentiphaga sp. NML030171]|uniref:ABC transporter substrate-binding protein n=1 Tax=Pigmentiphaga sp. NML030171 TaxID=2008676 RepID=UPI000B40D63A|nr:ABC transporter substrate-binding protein [Pigmentiphaga sp. NML030171]OVZ59812.1 ABC transporter substrate-binding protein [Pigmentiphaga sp. NML030171]
MKSIAKIQSTLGKLVRSTLYACAAVAVLSGNAAAAAKVRIGVVGSLSDASIYIAEAKGYFKDEGIDAEIIRFPNSAQMIAPIGAGQLDVAVGATSAGLYNSIGRGIDIKVVADKGSMPPGHGYVPLLVRKDLVDSGAFKSLKDLKGLRVGSQSPGGSALSLLNEALKKGGVPYKDVKISYMGHSQLAAALQNKALDAAMVTEPNATRAVQTGTVVRFSPQADQIYPSQQVAVVLYRGAFARQEAATATKVMRAYIRATRDYNDALVNGKLTGKNSDEIISILSKSTNEKDPSIYKVATAHGCHPDGMVNVASMKHDYEFFKEQGLITTPVDIDKVVDMSFARAVVNELGPYKPK